MAAFNYQISITGDCSNLSLGSISVLPSNGTPPYTVEWIEPSLGIDTLILTASTRTGLSGGTYSLRLNDSTVPINQEFYLNIPVSTGVCASIISVNSTTCNLVNGSVTGTSTSNYSSTNFYLYNVDDTFVSSGITNSSLIIFNGLSASTYYMVAEDLGGCTGKTQSFIIDPSESFDFGIYIVPNSSCGGTPIGKLYVTGQTGGSPYTYLWNNGETTNSVTGLTAGDYSVQVTNSLGCSATRSATLTNVDPIGFGVFYVTQPTCLNNDGEIILEITGGTAPYYYSASTGNVEISYSKTFTLSNLYAGQYNFLVTDAGFCTINVGTALLTPQSINSVDVVATNSTCSSTNGLITLVVNGGTPPFVYTIVKPNGDSSFSVSNQTTYSFTDLSGGTYTVSLQDSAGCNYTDEVTIITENAFTISYQTTGTTCSQNNGIIEIIKTDGGTQPFTFSLDNTFNNVVSVSATTFTNVSAGQHTVSVTDADGCTQSAQVTVESSVPLNYTLYSTSCGNGSDGKITSFITSGTPPFVFNWSENVFGNPQEITVSGLTAGTYSLTVVDANQCSLTRSTNIDCIKQYTTYSTYAMGTQTFKIQSQTKYGLLQMLNQGYLDLIADNTGCVFNSATFTAQVQVIPTGTTPSQLFYTTYSLTDVPSDNLWYNTITSLLNSIPGIGTVTVDVLNNQINITSSTVDKSLLTQELILNLVIEYDIMCLT